MRVTSRLGQAPRRTAAAAAAVAVLVLPACGAGGAGGVAAGAPGASADATDVRSPGVRVVSGEEGLRLAGRAGTVLLDVRTPAEHADGHVEGARNLAFGDDFAARVGELPRDGSYVLYCASGNRSSQAARAMAALGFADVADAGGLPALVEAGARVVR